VLSALSIYDADANAHLSILHASRKSSSLGWDGDGDGEVHADGRLGYGLQMENEMKIDTRISVDMSMPLEMRKRD
jgi:hypothetical protein